MRVAEAQAAGSGGRASGSTGPELAGEVRTPGGEANAPACNGPAPTDDGRTLDSEAQAPTGNGPAPVSDGRTPGAEAQAPTTDGPAPTAEGLALTTDGLAPTTESPTPPIHPLIALTGGLPLALRVVAARLAARSALTPDVLAGQLAAAESRLHHLEYDDLSVRRSLAVAHDALAASEHELDRDAALALRRIGAVDLPAYGAPLLARLTGTDERRAEAALDRLVDVALLEETAYGRYAPTTSYATSPANSPAPAPRAKPTSPGPPCVGTPP